MCVCQRMNKFTRKQELKPYRSVMVSIASIALSTNEDTITSNEQKVRKVKQNNIRNIRINMIR